ncbi:FkbM family methyltransferase [Methylomonas methanica]|uniref:Methyltransferase FkbM family n=1 Tax=Methylomonas methanica (strain DSM 25384 / MC09) TaxID=857087 RepID=G0A1S8_METMM|nr:FkbM family methyltransferase [Methylomonas methanica]AEG01311.1 methyltransferase FkbM family [Methylomonas methanica MC09]
MNDHDQTLLQIVNHIVNQHPLLAADVEKIAAYAQGKGYGTATIEQEAGLLQQLLQDQPTLAIDVGGNIGNYTAELRKRNPALEIHIFEPSTINLAQLSARFESDSLVKIVPYALSEQAGSATLFSDKPGSGMGSLTQRRLDHFNIEFDTTETISTMRFEDYWQTQLQSRQLDMVKIDVEGHELAALKGFGAALDVTRVLQFEFGGTHIDTRTYFQDFWYFFIEQGFDLYRITPFGAKKISRYSESDEFFAITNYIAVNQRR